jgi:hypothetical protein
MRGKRDLGIRSGYPITAIILIAGANPHPEDIFRTICWGDVAPFFEKLECSRDLVVSGVADELSITSDQIRRMSGWESRKLDSRLFKRLL